MGGISWAPPAPSLAQTLQSLGLVAGRISLLCCALLLVGCELNPRGELPGADNGAPPTAGEPTIPLPEVGGDRPAIDPLPNWPEFPGSDDGDDQGGDDSANTDDAPPSGTTDVPLPPTVSDDDELPPDGPIFADAGAAIDPTEDDPGGADGGVDPGVPDASSSEPETEDDGDDTTGLPSGSDAGVSWPEPLDGGPIVIDPEADGGADSGADAGADAGLPDAGLDDRDAGPVEAGASDGGLSSVDAGQ